jgi:hypothetical protein
MTTETTTNRRDIPPDKREALEAVSHMLEEISKAILARYGSEATNSIRLFENTRAGVLEALEENDPARFTKPQGSLLYQDSEEALRWICDRLQDSIDEARRLNTPVLVEMFEFLKLRIQSGLVAQGFGPSPEGYSHEALN